VRSRTLEDTLSPRWGVNRELITRDAVHLPALPPLAIRERQGEPDAARRPEGSNHISVGSTLRKVLTLRYASFGQRSNRVSGEFGRRSSIRARSRDPPPEIPIAESR